MSRDELFEACMAAFEKATEQEHPDAPHQISAAKFVHEFKLEWFYNRNKPHKGPLTSANGSFVGVLQKNIEITDISHPEIIVLFRNNTKIASTEDKCIPYFHNDKDISVFLQEICLLSNSNKMLTTDREYEAYIVDRSKKISKYYGNILRKTIVIDFYATSFSCYIPPSLSVNLESLVAESGYIHSLGHQLYVRRAERSVLSELCDRIQSFADEWDPTDPIYITPYSSEFFNNEESKSPVSMGQGLDGIKVSARKHHIGVKSVLEAIPYIRDNIENYSLLAPKTDNYSKERGSITADSNFTIFIMQDRSLVYSKTDRRLKIGDEIYLICYAQRLKNENVLHIFKESKPAWIEPVTLPHTLSSSLINIACGRLDDARSPIVLDPFCGSGTTLFDVAQRHPNAKLIGLDRNPASALMTKDNLQFLAGDEYDEYEAAFSKINNFLESSNIDLNDLRERYLRQKSNIEETIIYEKECNDILNVFLESLAFVCGAVAERASDRSGLETPYLAFDQLRHVDFAHFIDGLGPFTDKWSDEESYIDVMSKIPHIMVRIIIYSCWRALFYNSFRFHAGFDDLPNAIRREFQLAHLRYEHLRNLKLKGVRDKRDGYEIHQGLFSAGIRLSHDSFARLLGEDHKFLSAENLANGLADLSPGAFRHFTVGCSLDAMDDLHERMGFNPQLIVTDPPYGFNTAEGGSDELEDTFARLAGCICRILAPNGVVAVTLPAQSKNGKAIPFYETKGLFVRQMIDQASELGRKISTRSSILPNSGTFPRPAWRWYSTRGVSRHSLLFKVE